MMRDVYSASSGGSMNQVTSTIHRHGGLQGHGVLTIVLFMLALAVATPAAASTPCENLASLALPNAKIDSAQMVAPGAFVQPAARGGGARGDAAGQLGSAAGQRAGNAAEARGARAGGPAPNQFANLPAFCRVTATLTPTSDSDIKTEI